MEAVVTRTIRWAWPWDLGCYLCGRNLCCLGMQICHTFLPLWIVLIKGMAFLKILHFHIFLRTWINFFFGLTFSTLFLSFRVFVFPLGDHLHDGPPLPALTFLLASDSSELHGNNATHFKTWFFSPHWDVFSTYLLEELALWEEWLKKAFKKDLLLYNCLEKFWFCDSWLSTQVLQQRAMHRKCSVRIADLSSSLKYAFHWAGRICWFIK